MSIFATLIFAFVVATIGVQAEQHVIHFDNKCGRGTPTLIQGSNVLSTGSDYIINGPILGATAYLQTGRCGFNGENCTAININLANTGSSTQFDVTPPHTSFIAVHFEYTNGCDGKGDTCSSTTCQSGNPPPVTCDASNVNLAISFCI
ncbi:hypothetical protein CPB83DRAFT_798900 [Crepidotus variabilis]|uniref:Glycopeptide n=1 Tax=Crepidotus variabilis TaxID=179855 RepID=A0A9P6JK89_9AGAR|nr:hypothetical protein CPB83DRAFT_798900 [Crepidotus variabilis]